MKKHSTFAFVMVLVLALMFVSCSTGTETGGTPSPSTPAVSNTTQQPSSVPEPSQTLAPTQTPVEENLDKILLDVNSGGSSNTMYNAAHYGLHMTYTGEYIAIMNYTELMLHGREAAANPETVDGFEYQAEDLQYNDGSLYFLLYDGDNGVYNLYSYDFENEPVRVSDETVYHYEFMDGRIIFTKEFVQGPIYAMNTDGSGIEQLTDMRAHSFVQDEGLIYFYATDAGTAPGLVEYNPSTGEETTVVFPFYSHNYLVYEGYVYYVLDNTYRSIHRMRLSDQTVEDLWLEMPEYTISLNISDGRLYILAGNKVYDANLDGSSRNTLFESEDSFQTGLYIYGNRIYATDGMSIYMMDEDTGNLYEYSLQ